MIEEKETQEKETTDNKPEGNIDLGNPPKTLSILDRAEENRKRMEELDKSLGEKLARLEQIEARRMLAGTADAGSKPIVKTDEEKAQESAKELVDRFFT